MKTGLEQIALHDEAEDVAREYIGWAKREGLKAATILVAMHWGGNSWLDVSQQVAQWWLARDGAVSPQGNSLSPQERRLFVDGLAKTGSPV